MNVLREEQNEEIFRSDILPDYERYLKSSKSPTLLFVAGQGAAGKSTSIERAKIEMQEKGEIVMLLQRDELREYFPGYRDQLKTHGAEGYKFSEEDTWKWYEKLKTEAIKHSASLIVETTFRKTNEILADVERFSKAGYTVNARVLGVHPEISSVATFLRYEDEIKNYGYGRAVDPKTHQASVEGLEKTVKALEQQGKVNCITVVSREGNVLDQCSPKKGERKASLAIKKAHSHLSSAQKKEIKDKWDRVLEIMSDRKAPDREIQAMKKVKRFTKDQER